MKIAVAGAGIGGLAAALALAKAGCAVTLIERATELSEAGAGLQLSPNATRVLRALGVLDAVAARSIAPGRVRIRRFSDGSDIAVVPLGEGALRRYGAPFLLAHRADLQAVLLARVQEEPRIELLLGSGVERVTPQDAGVALAILENGQWRDARFDGLVGADGLRSAVRAATLPGTPSPRFSGRLAWRALLPAGCVPGAAREAASQLWLGPHAHLVHYPVREGRLVNVVAIVDGARNAGDENWARPGEPAALLQRFRAWAPEATSLLRASPGWAVWPLFDLPPLPRWSEGAVTLLGDAAHPMLPFLAQGAAQAISDAGALGEAVARAATFADAARRYEAGRRATAGRVQRESARQGRVYHLAGPLALARDTTMRLLGPGRMGRRYDWLYAAPS